MIRNLWRIGRAFLMAAWGHRHQRDKAGKRYIWHLVRVAWLAYGLQPSADVVVVGLLHDYEEDLGWDAGWKIRERFGSHTWRETRSLTRRAGDTYSNYIGWIVIEGKGGTEVTRAVKLADLLHNTQPRRLPKCNDEAEEAKTINRLYEYQQAIDRLTAQRTWADSHTWRAKA